MMSSTVWAHLVLSPATLHSVSSVASCHRIIWHCSGARCDRTTSEMRGLSPKIISGDSRRSENAQTYTNKHTISNIKFKLKLLQIKCHVLGFTKDKALKCASKDNQSFCGSVRLSR
jgi:hypothetical protein